LVDEELLKFLTSEQSTEDTEPPVVNVDQDLLSFLEARPFTQVEQEIMAEDQAKSSVAPEIPEQFSTPEPIQVQEPQFAEELPSSTSVDTPYIPPAPAPYIPGETKTKQQLAQELPVEEKKPGTIEALGRSAAGGAAELALNFARIPQTAAEVYVSLNNLTNRGVNKLVETASFGKVKGPYREVPHDAIPKFIKLDEDAWDVKAIKGFAEKQKEIVSAVTDSKGVLDHIGSGEIGKAAQTLGVQVAAQVPLILSMMVGGAAGAGAKTLGGLAGATETSSKLEEYWDQVEEGTARQDPNVAGVHALTSGAIEALGETMVTGRIIKEALEKITKGAGEEVAKKAVGNAVGRAVGRIMKAAGEEGLEETIVGYSQAVSDQVFGSRDVTFLQAVKEGAESGLVGMFASGVTTGPVSAYAERGQVEKPVDETGKEALLPTAEEIEQQSIPEYAPEKKLPTVKEAEKILTEQEAQAIEQEVTPDEKMFAERVRAEQEEKVTPEPSVIKKPTKTEVIPDKKAEIKPPKVETEETTLKPKVEPETSQTEATAKTEDTKLNSIKDTIRRFLNDKTISDDSKEIIYGKAKMTEEEIDAKAKRILQNDEKPLPPLKTPRTEATVKSEVKKEKPVEKEPEKKELKPEKPKGKQTAKVEGQTVDTAPSEAQKEAGNYKKAHINRDGMEISIENPAGSTRSGTDKTGKEWSQTMKSHYGYIRGTKGYDKDHLDVFIKPDSKEGGTAFVVNQVEPSTGKFDEHKVVFGAKTEQEAKDIYLSNYEKGWKGFKSVVPMDMKEFKEWSISDGPGKGELKPKILSKDYVSEAKETKLTAKDKDVFKLTKEARKKSLDITNKEIEIAKRDQKIFDLNKNKSIQQLEKEIQESKKFANKKNASYPRSVQVKEEIIRQKKQAKQTELLPENAKATKRTTRGSTQGVIVGTKKVKGKTFYRFKSAKTGRIELVAQDKIFEAERGVEKEPKELIKKPNGILGGLVEGTIQKPTESLKKEFYVRDLLASDHGFKNFHEFKDAINNYAPLFSVKKIGNMWVYKTIEGTEQGGFKTRKAAVNRAKEHQNIFRDKLKDPFEYLSGKSQYKVKEFEDKQKSKKPIAKPEKKAIFKDEENYERKDYSKYDKKAVDQERKNLTKRTEASYNGVLTETERIQSEKDRIEFASKLKQEIYQDIKGDEYKHLIGNLDRKKDGSLYIRNENTEKKLQSIADSWNLARDEGRGATQLDVPPDNILHSSDNWSSDDVVDLLREGLNKKDLSEYQKKTSAEIDKLEENYEKELDYIMEHGERLEKRAEEIGAKEEKGYKESLAFEKIEKTAIEKNKKNEKIKPFDVPSSGKEKTPQKLRSESVLDTAKKSKSKGKKKTKEIKAVSDVSKQIQFHPDKKKTGSGWLSKWDMIYFDKKEIAWPILKMRKVLKDFLRSHGILDKDIDNQIVEDTDHAVDRVRASGEIAQIYLEENYNPIFAPLDKFSSKERGTIARSLSEYLVAKRSVWLYNNKVDYRDGGISLETAETIVDYIENNHPQGDLITGMAQDVWNYTKGLKSIKHENGVIDDELFMNLREPYYVPFIRDVDTEKHEIKGPPQKLRFTSSSTGIKRIKGQEEDYPIIDPLQLIVSSTRETITNANKAQVMQNIVKIADKYPEVFEGLIEKIDPKWRKAGTIEHRIQVDETLRDQIDEFAKKIGVSVETAYKLGEKGKKGSSKRLALFDNEDKKIRILYGATESTRAHELGHALDEKYWWITKLLNKYKRETDAVAASRYESEKASEKFRRYVHQQDEKTAEFISLYLSNRPMLQNLAPNAYLAFEQRIAKDPLLKELKNIQPTNVKSVESFEEANWVQDTTILQDEDVVPVRIKGKFEQYRVPIEMAMAVKNLHPVQIPGWLQWTLTALKIPTKMLRFGAVIGNVGFWLPNIGKDQINIAHNEKIIPFVDWFIGAGHFIGNTEVYKHWRRRGGGMSSPESGISGNQAEYAQFVYGSKSKQFVDPFYWETQGVLKGISEVLSYALKTPFRKTIGYACELSEAGSRVGVFGRGLVSSKEYKEGKIDLNDLKASDALWAIGHAIHASRHGSGDFLRFGYSMKEYNNIFPFINMALEGFDRMVRAWYNPIHEGRVPVRQIMFTTLTFAMYAGLTAWNRMWEDEYKKISSREKANNWIFILGPEKILGKNYYLKFPKAHVTRFILNPAQMIYESIEGLTQQSGWGLTIDIFTELSPVDPSSVFPVTAKLIIEPIVGYDTYWKKDIESPMLKSLPPGYRYKKNTSETLRSIGRSLNISPVVMQHELRTLLGGTATNILWLTDYALGLTGAQKPPDIDLSRAIIIKRFLGQIEDWKSDAAQRTRELAKEEKRVTGYYQGKATFEKLVRAGYTKKEAAEAIEAQKKYLEKIQRKKRELENTTRKINGIQNKIKSNNKAVKFVP
jgi:hypothetical protein